MVVVVRILLEHFFSLLAEVLAAVEVEVVVEKLGQCGRGEAPVVRWIFRLRFR